jgi:uncharacterized protein (DUF1778 family)
MDRSVLIIRCSRADADVIRAQARLEHRTVSGYLLHVLDRSLWVDATVFDAVSHLVQTPVSLARAGNRTAICLRCSAEEATRIRVGAKRRRMSISNFVIFCLHRRWQATESLGQAPVAGGSRN